MSDTQETPQHLIWIKTLDDALLGIRVSLRILSEKLDMLHRLSERHELQFDWEGKFLGMTRDSPAQSLLPNHSQCLDAKVSCPLFIKWAESLWESHHEAETALSEMPSWASETLNASAGQNWRAMVLRECLDRVLIWPNEKIHNLAAAKVSGDPTSLLDNTFKYEPYDDWQAMCVKLDEYRGDLVAIRYEGIQDPPPKPIPSEPTGNFVEPSSVVNGEGGKSNLETVKDWTAAPLPDTLETPAILQEWFATYAIMCSSFHSDLVTQPWLVNRGLQLDRLGILCGELAKRGERLEIDASLLFEFQASVKILDESGRMVGAATELLDGIFTVAKRIEARTAGDSQQQGEAKGIGGDDAPKKPKAKAKRSAAKGDTDKKRLIIAALNDHHQYSNGKCEDVGHVGVNKLAKHLEISPSTVSGFFKAEFGGHDRYITACGDLGNLANALKILNGEITPKILFNPLGNKDRNLADE